MPETQSNDHHLHTQVSTSQSHLLSVFVQRIIIQAKESNKKPAVDVWWVHLKKSGTSRTGKIMEIKMIVLIFICICIWFFIFIYSFKLKSASNIVSKRWRTAVLLALIRNEMFLILFYSEEKFLSFFLSFFAFSCF